MAAKLAKLGFQVTTAIDLDQAAMREALRRFGRTSEGAAVSLVFYAGHGLQVSGENYLLPVDIAVRRPDDLRSAGLPMSTIQGGILAVHVVTPTPSFGL